MKKLGLSLVAVLAFIQISRAAEGNWLTDFEKAQTMAKEQKKLVLMDFTGSDWCPPCKLLHKNVLTSKEFVEFAKDNLVLVVVDFPNRNKPPVEVQKANDALAKKFKVEGFPTVIVLDGNGKQLMKEVGYHNEDGKEYVAKLKRMKAKS
jgi:protein disulfide-isomerase